MRNICALILMGLAAGCGQTEPQFTSEAARREHEKLQARLQQGYVGSETRTSSVRSSGTVDSAAALRVLVNEYEGQLDECEDELRADPTGFPADPNQARRIIREGRATIKRIRAQLATNADHDSLNAEVVRLIAQMDQFETLFEQVE